MSRVLNDSTDEMSTRQQPALQNILRLLAKSMVRKWFCTGIQTQGSKPRALPVSGKLSHGGPSRSGAMDRSTKAE